MTMNLVLPGSSEPRWHLSLRTRSSLTLLAFCDCGLAGEITGATDVPGPQQPLGTVGRFRYLT